MVKHGLLHLLQSTKVILQWNVQIKEFVIEKMENVNVSRTMMAWHAKGHHAQMIALAVVFVFLKCLLQTLLQLPIVLHGMQESTSGANVILVIVVLTALRKSVPLDLM